MIVLNIAFDPGNNGAGPLNYQCFQAILLIQVVVHVLLHGFDWQLGVITFFIIFQFLSVYITDNVLELLQWKHLLMGLIA